ncbi:amino acid transporter [Secundilactobacillus silagincola]|jgi:L-lysine exporter family protein LysE/ArgO|uniref:Amino acid transporter n=1 Tax=Secundilactobacillus silagincola TaxID=1714681 RepID=A0A1Z5J0N5_9LACO|nr:LysE family transporter [Secundilactobacillus silagincola]GAX07446.1 amino acid transporter [Secundilactobacillus silagincola]
MMAVVLRGMLISFALVSSIGMQNLFVFNSAMSNRMRRALLICLFVWIADTTLTTVAFLGMGALISHYLWLKIIIMLLGGLIVIWMGIGILRSASQIELGKDDSQLPLKDAFASAWIVAFANPQAIIDTGVTMGALRGTLTNSEVLPFLGGIILATAIWFFSITIIVGILKNRLPKRILMWINIISGVIVLGYGIALLINAARLIL